MRRAERLLLLLLRLVRPTLDISLTIFLVCCSIGGVLKYGGVPRVTSLAGRLFRFSPPGIRCDHAVINMKRTSRSMSTRSRL